MHAATCATETYPHQRLGEFAFYWHNDMWFVIRHAEGGIKSLYKFPPQFLIQLFCRFHDVNIYPLHHCQENNCACDVAPYCNICNQTHLNVLMPSSTLLILTIINKENCLVQCNSTGTLLVEILVSYYKVIMMLLVIPDLPIIFTR